VEWHERLEQVACRSSMSFRQLHAQSHEALLQVLAEAGGSTFMAYDQIDRVSVHSIHRTACHWLAHTSFSSTVQKADASLPVLARRDFTKRH
jgi:hypothetical protein